MSHFCPIKNLEVVVVTFGQRSTLSHQISHEPLEMHAVTLRINADENRVDAIVADQAARGRIKRPDHEIGSAACRERAKISVVADALKTSIQPVIR